MLLTFGGLVVPDPMIGVIFKLFLLHKTKYAIRAYLAVPPLEAGAGA